jgi:hypothetical protein
MSSIPIADSHDLVLGDSVELNSGGPSMTVIEITVPGRNTDISSTSDVVAWWRAKDGSPQIVELDSRCVRPARLTTTKTADCGE